MEKGWQQARLVASIIADAYLTLCAVELVRAASKKHERRWHFQGFRIINDFGKTPASSGANPKTFNRFWEGYMAGYISFVRWAPASSAPFPQHIRPSHITMRYQICILLALVAAAYASGIQSDVDRSFFGTGNYTVATFTLIKYSTTLVSTLTSTTTCTTSTSSLALCTAGRRRRGLFYDEGQAEGRNRRGLFYNDDEVENKDGSVFIAK